jgi:hypothetical protein
MFGSVRARTCPVDETLERLSLLLSVALILAGAVACEATGTGSASGTGDAGRSSDEACSTNRYTVIDSGNPSSNYSMVCPTKGSGCDGSGLVEDTTTGLVWMRFEYFPVDPNTLSSKNPGQTYDQAVAYCTRNAMRLPTLSEAEGIAGLNTLHCVWQPYWATWTQLEASQCASTIMRSDGSTVQDASGAPALCVR